MGQRKTRVLIGTIGLGGHDRGAMVVARALRDAGFEVIYTGIRQRIDDVVSAAVQETDCVLSADTDAAVVSTRATDTTDFAGGAIVVAVFIESQDGSDTTTLESCSISVAP